MKYLYRVCRKLVDYTRLLCCAKRLLPTGYVLQD